MAYYHICPNCGCNLDPGEKCDCKEKVEKQQDFFSRYLKVEPKSEQLSFALEGMEVDKE